MSTFSEQIDKAIHLYEKNTGRKPTWIEMTRDQLMQLKSEMSFLIQTDKDAPMNTYRGMEIRLGEPHGEEKGIG